MTKLNSLLTGLPLTVVGYLIAKWDISTFLPPIVWAIFAVIVWLMANYFRELDRLIIRVSYRLKNRHVSKDKLKALTYEQWLEQDDVIDEHIRQLNYRRYCADARKTIDAEWWHFWRWGTNVTVVQELSPNELERELNK